LDGPRKVDTKEGRVLEASFISRRLDADQGSLGQFFELSLDVNSGVPHIPHRFGEPLLRYTEFVGPILNFVRLQEADAASVLRTFIREIVGHKASLPI
jgi:hypothetical protein